MRFLTLRYPLLALMGSAQIAGESRYNPFMPANGIITRFAPSPTGALHIGGARTALFNWAFARKYGGQFILRIEDTDQARSTAESANGILGDLRWLGIDWDAGPSGSGEPGSEPYANQVGDHGPYFQSQRLPLYQQHIERLLNKDQAYVPDDEPEIVRLRMGTTISFTDAIYGQITVQGQELNDFVIRKADGFPTFHLAVVVDDALMGVTHVIRGQEHLSNTPRHVALQEALDFARPTYVHVPSILNPDGSKMSKRDKAKEARATAKSWLDSRDKATSELAGNAGIQNDLLIAFLNKKTDDLDIANALAAPAALDFTLPDIEVADFRRSGFLPEAICNYIVLLGWNPGRDVEQFDRKFLVENFSLDRIGKANAKFDRDKLLAFNADRITSLPTKDWRDRLHSHLLEHNTLFSLLSTNDEHFAMFADAYQERSRTLDDPARLGKFFVFEPDSIQYDERAIKKVLAGNDRVGFELLGALQSQLRDCVWSLESIHATLETVAQEHAVGFGKVAQPLRVAVSGGTVSPPIDQTLMILGKTATLARIEHCLRMSGSGVW